MILKHAKKSFLSVLILIVLIAFVVTPVFAQAGEPVEVVNGPDLGMIAGTLVVITGLAFLVETLVEALFGRIVDHIPFLVPYKWALFYIAVLAGILGAFNYQFDVLYLLFMFVGVPSITTIYGITITGIAIGMGAVYIHQFISKFFPSKPGAAG